MNRPTWVITAIGHSPGEFATAGMLPCSPRNKTCSVFRHVSASVDRMQLHFQMCHSSCPSWMLYALAIKNQFIVILSVKIHRPAVTRAGSTASRLLQLLLLVLSSGHRGLTLGNTFWATEQDLYCLTTFMQKIAVVVWARIYGMLKKKSASDWMTNHFFFVVAWWVSDTLTLCLVDKSPRCFSNRSSLCLSETSPWCLSDKSP